MLFLLLYLNIIYLLYVIKKKNRKFRISFARFYTNLPKTHQKSAIIHFGQVPTLNASTNKLICLLPHNPHGLDLKVRR